jgi:poly-gamma-glutamate synthesis protein (capsule biosynthesis protein)
MKNEAITLLGLGDIIIDRERPETIFQHVTKVLRSADFVFASGDQVYSEKGTIIPGYGIHSDPKCIEALLYAGVKVVALANNHSMDRGEEALLDSIARLKEAGLPFVGAGTNLTEAHQPVMLECKGTKIGFLSYSSVHSRGYEAKENKPGIAPIRAWTFYEQVDYQPGTPPRIVTIPYKDDLTYMVEDIKKLKAQVDIVVIYNHWGQHLMPRVIPMYCFDIAYAAIDAGADLILGTHPHILKGIEVYKGKVIFYSTCNFALETSLEHLKSELLTGGARKNNMIHYKFVPDPECPTYPLPRESRATLIAKAIIEDGKIQQVSYIPCYINNQAEPEIVTRDNPRAQEIFDYISDISKSEGLSVNFSWQGNEVLINTT